MNHKKIAVVLALTAAAATNPVFAIPISFEFSGTVQSRTIFDNATGTSVSDTSWIGQAFTAQFVLDTGRFAPPVSAEFPAWHDQSQFTDSDPLAPWSGSLDIAGNAINVQPYAFNFAALQINDTKGPQSCGAGCSYGVPDAVTLVLRSDLQDSRGTTNSSLFQLNAYQALDFADPDPAHYTYIDLTQPFPVDGLLTMALPNLSFQYTTSTFDCDSTPGLCFSQGYDMTRFNVETVTRTDLSTASVPEPATLGLLCMGLLAARLARRRRVAA